MTTADASRSCLIVERLDWETGGGEQQIQLPIALAEDFFGPGNASREITVRLFSNPAAPDPDIVKRVSISMVYPNRSRRVNGFREVGAMPPCFLFFEEQETPGVYDVWFIEDKEAVIARFGGWQQSGATQYGPARRACIVPAPVRRRFATT